MPDHTDTPGLSYAFAYWQQLRGAPEWVRTPTVEIWRATDDGETVWAFSLAQLPAPRGGIRRISGTPPWAQDGPGLHLSIFTEGLAALADPDFAWFFTALAAEHAPTTLDEVAALLTAHGATDDTEHMRAAQGLLPTPEEARR
ncbi:hypothetical protein D7D52_36030 [Nocardia yunnanensis]|uniref:Uncharacterized protein n=1 Tax=Nocardia yunnanensis TaxID=2382165 RepID=A0A386ZNS3_9NOCA|nr:hypothetical protein [Nocardia yunnanensis]AYF78349.1 hypothetical protein D7D52_36030 [Nocardia yunnanensis]